MPQLTQLRLSGASESSVDVILSFAVKCDDREFHGCVYGPKCAFAQTLPTEFQLEPIASSQSQSDALAERGEQRFRAQVLEPCYWTPALPFLYQITMEWIDDQDVRQQASVPIGLHRLAARGPSLYRDSRRFVLRGIQVDELNHNVADAARANELALWIEAPTDDQCELADRGGIALVADLRHSNEVAGRAQQLVVRPSVSLVIVDATAMELTSGQWARQPGNAFFAACARSAYEARAAETSPSDAIALVLAHGERPFECLTECSKPVIAICEDPAYADLSSARAACDRLQAAWRPEFDLAGYFVGPPS